MLELMTRRQFALSSVATAAFANFPSGLFPQDAGERPLANPAGVRVLNPADRVPLSWIIDDSTCLVNLNKFAIPQFAAAFPAGNSYEKYDWKSWPDEIPDDFVRKFADWSGEKGVKGKYSIVPYPACVGRLDRGLPGWNQNELTKSIQLVRERIQPNWDIHPEMVTHTRVIDLKTGHPYPELSKGYMENWDWSVGKSPEELQAYFEYALSILKNIGLDCEGVTTPGGFGNRSRVSLAQATLRACRNIYGTEIPHYFRDLYDEGEKSVEPQVYYAKGLNSEKPECSVSIIGCTGDWTGGWDNSEPDGVDKFITQDLKSGRLVDVIERGEPACMVCHWTGIYFNGEERGFKIMQELERRLTERFPRARWMKLAEIARYWAAKTLTQIEKVSESQYRLSAPFASPDFCLEIPGGKLSKIRVESSNVSVNLREVSSRNSLAAGCFWKSDKFVVVCFDLNKGGTTISISE